MIDSRQYQRTLGRQCALAVFILAVTTTILHADLTQSDFSDLVVESDVIAEGRVVRSEILGPGLAGEALVAITVVHKGSCPDPRIRIKWTSEEHDQRVDRVGEDRLFFLRHIPGGYEGTQYGRSYWVIQQGDYGVLFIPYSYPTSKVTMDVPNMVKTTGANIRVVYLKDVLDYVKRRQ